ncbi:MAG: transporter ATP-binding protein [Frankiales bacterium]|nr:transporter ATP-binding protein [Frankiales bacterium]
MTAVPALEVRALTARHGQLTAVDGVGFSVPAGSVFALVGANGAGKSTLLRTIAGLHRPVAGSVHLHGDDVTATGPERRVGRGLVLVPEGRRLFPSLSVHENLRVGLARRRPGQWDIDRVLDLFPWMKERRNQPAGQLSGGEQQAVAIGRALVANPSVLLLDEISLGLAPVVVQRIYGLLPALLTTGMTVVLVEQDVSQALAVADQVQCLLEGRTVLDGVPAQLTGPQIEAAYFGLAGAGR